MKRAGLALAAWALCLTVSCGRSDASQLDFADGGADAVNEHADAMSQACSLAGSLDPTFGAAGVVKPLFADQGLSAASAVVVDPITLRIIVAGGSPSRDGKGMFTLLRLQQNGDLDLDFAFDGVSRACPTNHDCWIEDIALQSDGKIVGVGGISDTDGARIALVRYTAEGTLDPSFGDGGIVVDPAALHAYGAALAMDDQHNLVVAVEAWDGLEPTDQARFRTVRYLPTGERDSSFGTLGAVDAPFGPGQHVPRDIAVQTNGKLVVVGWKAEFESSAALAIVRYAEDGELDSSFGSGGIQALPGAYAMGVSTDPQSRLIVSGGTGTNGIVTRWLPDGSADISFGSSGVAADLDSRWNVAVTANGNTMGVGTRQWGLHDIDVALAAYSPDGDLNLSFGSYGRVFTPTDHPCNTGNAAAVQADGAIVVVGSRGDCVGESDFFIARYCP